MSFDEEWAAERSAAAARVSMRLNQAPGGGGPGGGADLKVRQDHLGALGHAAYELHGRLLKDGKHAGGDTAEAASGLSRSGFRTGAAMAEVNDTWTSQLGALLDACAHISNHLDYSAAAHAKDDDEIRTALAVSRISEYFK